MRKRFLLCIFTLIFPLSFISGCGYETDVAAEYVPDPIELFYEAITLDYPADVMDALSGFGNSHNFGFRTAGSPAELAAAEYLYSEMLNIGLENVVKFSVTVDSWEFTKAELTIELSPDVESEDEDANNDVEIRSVTMAAYPVQLECEDEEVQLIYAGRGTEADYEDIDVEGKLVLIDIDQRNDWWINWPAYQAKHKGAVAVIAVSTGGYFQYSIDTLGVHDTRGPSDAPAFSITARDGDMLKELIGKSENGEITVKLTSDSKIEEGALAYSVIGEIPGTTDEAVYLIAHYDGFFGGYDNNASGVGAALGIAKALLDSGYEPQKTIRFILHPAEEWGGADSTYGTAEGAYQTINKHPGWVENAFALIDLDGGITSNYADGIEISASRELMDFVLDVGFDVEGGPFGDFEVVPSVSSQTGDFPYAQKGIPALRSGFSGDEEKFEDVYHSNMDTRDYFFNEDAILFTQKLYGTYVIELDRAAVKPLNYIIFFEDLLDSIDVNAAPGAEALEDAVYMAIDASKDLSGKIEKWSSDFDPEEAISLNANLERLARSIQDKLISLNCEGEVIFAHERYQSNMTMLRAAVRALREGDADKAVDEYLSKVDLNRSVLFFDEATYDYFVKRIPDNAELYEVISMIKQKSETEGNRDYLPEAESIDIANISQQKALKDVYSQMTKDVISITKMIDRMAE